jgi:RNA polymerase sigma-70 factor (ECF subfamily)
VNEDIAAYLPQVYRFALRLTNDRHLAEDLTQETFVRAWQHRKQRKQERATRTWLLHIAANVWKDGLRRRPPPGGHADLLNSIENDTDLQPDRAAENREDLSHALTLLGRLPPRQREVLYLIAVEGLSLNEVSEVLEITGNAAKVNLSLARKQMRVLLNMSQPQPDGTGSHRTE